MPDSSRARESGENPSTYVVQDRQNKEELERLKVQDHMLTVAMGGVLPEQPYSSRFRHVLDIGSGSGSWAIETAHLYPDMTLVGIDISSRMVEYAQTQAQTLNGRVTFQVMDALRPLQFPDGTFDLVNMRLGVSFLRTWEWPSLLCEIRRITRPEGVVRLTETTLSPQRCNSEALMQLFALLTRALHRAGHLFDEDETSVIPHLAPLLQRFGYQEIQHRLYDSPVRADMPGGQMYIADTSRLFRTVRPFIDKWIGETQEYEGLYQQALADMALPSFEVQGLVATVWAEKPLQVQTQ